MTLPNSIKIGTRGSLLSITQTEIVKHKIESLNPGIKCEIVRIKTLNEKIDRSNEKSTEKDIYTKEIDEALISGSIDIAVHSLKDLKNEMPDGIALAAIPERSDPLDVIIKGKGFSRKAKPLIGTSSIRRKAQMHNLVPNAIPYEIHGNVDTRLKALENETVDGLILAASGLERLGYKIYERISPKLMVPAIGQGALAVTARSSDAAILRMLEKTNDKKAELEITAERAFGRIFGIGCDLPIGALAELEGNMLHIIGFIGDLKCTKIVMGETDGKASDPKSLGRKLASIIKEKGGDDIIGNEKFG